MHEDVPAPLVFGGTVSQLGENCLIILLYQGYSFLIICGSCQMYETQVSTDNCEEFNYKLRGVLG